ncbi:16591_t:CDS:10 [Entrophospora sp. SA101]|nr:16591_t:CDS:10 [Entrophospora sp. SA101]
MPYSSLFRSEEMSLIQLYIPSETVQPTMAELGELGLIQFRDLNPDVNAFQRAFVSEVRRFDEIERRLRYFSVQIAKTDIPIYPLTGARARSVQELNELEETINQHEQRIIQMNNSYETLQKRYLELTEARHVLQETAIFFEEVKNRQDIRQSLDEPTAPLLDHTDVEQGESLVFRHANFRFVTGVILRTKMQIFERILWRALRGNFYINHAEIDELITDPETDEVLEKNVFIIFSHGQEILNKIKKISESLGATLYPVDDNPDQRHQTLMEITTSINDLNSVLQSTNQARRTELLKVAENLSIWFTIIKKEKAIYHAMNLFNYDSTRKCLIAEGWCPTNDIGQIHNALREQSRSMVPSILNELRTTKEPPTFHRVNKFTGGFQEIVDAYGIAKYREVNPGLFTIITFPFLFAVMFGDLGHGVFVTLAALYLIVFEKRLERNGKGEIFEMFFGGRYIILLMGLFSMYTGLMYNDIFSLSLKLAKPGFEWIKNDTDGTYKVIQTGVYPFGIDPSWHGAENYLLFTNSYKMKMSIILGVIHMSFGQTIRNSPPGLLNTLIYMFLQPGKVAAKDQLYPGQDKVQFILLIIALICVPWMLLTKPLIMRHDHKKIRAQGYHNPQTDATRISTDENNEHGGAVVTEEIHEEEEFDFGEIMIHQVIHTIEFCLGCISNTASYLRLWALSLAHAQLSSVLWDMTLKTALNYQGVLGVILIAVASIFWFILTIGILILMEGLSAFLHALRLHWVEFNNKFYEGTDHRIKYLLEALKKEPNGLQKHEESELFLLLSQVRGIGSKWSNPDKIGQAELYEAINSVFNSLKNYTEHSGPFLKKVNAKEVPDYYQIITNPMDLSIISKRIKNTHYNSKKEFSDDLYLIYSNCLLYNTNPDNEYRKHAIAMREKTDALLQSVPDITILSQGAQAIELYDDNSDSDSGCEVDEWDIRLRQEFKVPFLSPLPLLWDPEINNPNRNKLSDPDYDPTENAPTIDEYPEAQIPKTGTAPIIDQNIELLKQCHPKDLPPLEMNYETSSAVMKCCVAKLLQHSGFESSMNTPLHILTEIAGDYLMNIGRTFRKYLDDYDKKMKPEEIVEHVLYENGIGSLNDIESYLRDDICRYGTKLKDLRRRLDTAFNEQIINPDGSGGGANNSEKIIDETLLENEDVFVTGNIVEEVDEDFFRFKELGLGPLSVPMKLFHGTNKTKYPVKKVDNSLENKYSPPPPWKPITDSSSRIGLLQEFFQLKTEQHNGQLIEDEQLPPKQKFQRPKVPPTGKIPPQPRRQPQKSVAELAAALAEKKRKREKELELLEQKERQKKLKLQEKAKKQAEKEEQKKQKQLEREQAKKAEKKAKIDEITVASSSSAITTNNTFLNNNSTSPGDDNESDLEIIPLFQRKRERRRM